MKNFNHSILALFAAGLLASCSLAEEPTSFVNRKSFYQNESQCIAALNSCYMPVNSIYTANFMLVTEACTDIWYSSSTTVDARSEEHTSELQSPPYISYAVFCLKKHV